MREADYLRGELIRAKGLLASAIGHIDAAKTIVPLFGNLPCIAQWQEEAEAFQQRGIAVLPPGVK